MKTLLVLTLAFFAASVEMRAVNASEVFTLRTGQKLAVEKLPDGSWVDYRLLNDVTITTKHYSLTLNKGAAVSFYDFQAKDTCTGKPATDPSLRDLYFFIDGNAKFSVNHNLSEEDAKIIADASGDPKWTRSTVSYAPGDGEAFRPCMKLHRVSLRQLFPIKVAGTMLFCSGDLVLDQEERPVHCHFKESFERADGMGVIKNLSDHIKFENGEIVPLSNINFDYKDSPLIDPVTSYPIRLDLLNPDL